MSNFGNEEEQSRKLFIGGISLDTTDDGMNKYFSKYGKITDCVVIKEKSSGRSKGFGFVTYETEEEADKCMADRPHSLDGRTIDAKRAVSREESSKPGAHVQVKKIFVGGVKEGLDESMLRQYFEQFGTIVSVDIPLDKEKQTPKGYGFITFDDFDVTDKLVAKRKHEISGFSCEVKKALSRDELEKSKQQLGMKMQRSGGFPRGGRGGRGRGRGRGGGGDGYGDYGDGYGGGPMRGQFGQSQRSGGPYGGGYGSGGYGGMGGGGGYGSGGYGAGGGGYGGGGYDNSFSGSYEGYSGNNNNGYGGYNNYYGDSSKYY